MIYRLSEKRGNYSGVRRVRLSDIGWQEKDLENLIANNIEDFINTNDLMTIFTERKGQEAPDILALDKMGELYIFELKREEGKQENILQVLRYGQLYGSSTYDELNDLYKKYIKKEQKNKTELSVSHTEHFTLAEPIEKNSYNATQHFLIMTNGIDQKTMKAIQYWKKVGLNIDAIVYWIYEIGSEHFIEFNTYSNDKMKIQFETKAFILNTDFSKAPEHHDYMIREHRAAAYGDFHKKKIEKLQTGDTVFLYKSGSGIVAFGTADGIVKKNDEECEYYMHLNDFSVLENPLSASRINEITRHDYKFLQTMFTISDDAAERLIEAITNGRNSDK